MLHLTEKEAADLGLIKRRKKISKPVQATWDAKVESGRIWINLPIPPSLNKWSRRHWSERSRQVTELSAALSRLRIAFRIPKVERPRVQLIYYFATNRRRDPDNYMGKMILDSLRHAEIIADDNSKVLQLPQPEFRVDREKPRTEILITEWRAEIGAGTCIE